MKLMVAVFAALALVACSKEPAKAPAAPLPVAPVTVAPATPEVAPAVAAPAAPTAPVTSAAQVMPTVKPVVVVAKPTAKKSTGCNKAESMAYAKAFHNAAFADSLLMRKKYETGPNPCVKK